MLRVKSQSVFIVKNLKCSPPPYIHKKSSSKSGRKFIQAIKVAAVCMDEKTLENPDSASFPDVALARRRGSFYSSSYSLQLATPFTRVIGSSIT